VPSLHQISELEAERTTEPSPREAAGQRKNDVNLSFARMLAASRMKSAIILTAVGFR
jgi:hypothetical protein